MVTGPGMTHGTLGPRITNMDRWATGGPNMAADWRWFPASAVVPPSPRWTANPAHIGPDRC